MNAFAATDCTIRVLLYVHILYGVQARPVGGSVVKGQTLSDALLCPLLRKLVASN